jgi:hypothetical protein
MDAASEDALVRRVPGSITVRRLVLAKVVDLNEYRRRACVCSFRADSRGSSFGFGADRCQWPLADGNGLCCWQMSLRQADAVISNLFANLQTSGNAALGYS